MPKLVFFFFFLWGFGGMVWEAIAKSIWEWRYWLAIGWPTLALIMMPFAYMLVQTPGTRASGDVAHMLHICQTFQIVTLKEEMPQNNHRPSIDPVYASMSKKLVKNKSFCFWFRKLLCFAYRAFNRPLPVTGKIRRWSMLCLSRRILLMEPLRPWRRSFLRLEMGNL